MFLNVRSPLPTQHTMLRASPNHLRLSKSSQYSLNTQWNLWQWLFNHYHTRFLSTYKAEQQKCSLWTKLEYISCGLEQGFSVWVCQIFWATSLFVVGGVVMCIDRGHSGTPALYPLGVISAPPPRWWQPKGPPDIAKCPLGNKIILGWEQLV